MYKVKDTYTAHELARLLMSGPDYPIYLYCAYNNYRIEKAVNIGDCILLQSPESDGCWKKASSIKDELKNTDTKVFEDDSPLIA